MNSAGRASSIRTARASSAKGRGADHMQIPAETWLITLQKKLASRDAGAVAELFSDDCLWRDFIAFTWNIITIEKRVGVIEMLAARLAHVAPTNFAIDGDVKSTPTDDEFWFTFETAVGRGKGHARLRNSVCRTFFTTLRELKGFEEKRGPTRDLGTQHGAIRNRTTWADARAHDRQLGIAEQPYCLIVGGGQGGLGLAARLKRIGVPALIVDRYRRPGDAWRSRYKSLCLHDPVWYDHMPYLPFPDHWPVFTPKDKMGDWLEAYASIMELDYWPSTECVKAQYDAASGEWAVEVKRGGQPHTLRPKHLILATGMSGKPNYPSFPGQSVFQGVQHHSSSHPGGAGFAGKRCVVVGGNNSAHDIAADLWEHGADVTMIQRSPTMVVRSDTMQRIGWTIYSEEALAKGIDADKADLMATSTPYALLPDVLKQTVARMRDEDADFYDRLSKAGFLLTFGEDETGIGLMYPRRGSGYYIDVGASELIISKQIKLKSRVSVSHLTENSVVLSDGSALLADLVVYATGYGTMDNWAAELISQDVADKVGQCWGIGSGTERDPGPWTGELRNMWKPTAQEGLWFHGGNLAQSRHFSRYVAIQMKARYEGLRTQVYRAPV